MNWGLGDWAALYAAIVATGALFLEVRRWFESSAKLRIGIMPEGKIASNRGIGEDTYLVVNVSNRGGSATTLTHFGMVHYGSWWRRIRDKPEKSFIVPHPHPAGASSGLPHLLAPGATWTGMAKHEKETMDLMETGDFWVQIYATHSDKPAYARVIKRKPPEGKKLES